MKPVFFLGYPNRLSGVSVLCLCIKIRVHIVYRDIRRGQSGGDSHHAISVIPVLGHRLYTCEYRFGARACQGFVDILSLIGWSVVTLKVHKIENFLLLF